MKFVHLSDSHLGLTQFDTINEQGINEREIDFTESFIALIDNTIEQKPEFVIHSGDLFHRSSPSNRAINLAVEQFRRLSEAGINLYLIPGNHDHPRTRSTDSIFYTLSTIPLVTVAYQEKYELIELDNAIIHLLPHINFDEYFNEQLELVKVTNANKINILSTHLSVGSETGYSDEIGGRVLGSEYFEQMKAFDYIALGHWHYFGKISQIGNAWYAGSHDYFRESEITHPKGLVVVEGDKNNGLIPKLLENKKRGYHSITIKNCKDKTNDQVISEIKVEIESEHTGWDEHKAPILTISLYDVTIMQQTNFSPEYFNKQLEKNFFEIIVKCNRSGDSAVKMRTTNKQGILDLLREEIFANFLTDEERKYALEVYESVLMDTQKTKGN